MTDKFTKQEIVHYDETPAKYISKTDKFSQFKKKGHCPLCTKRLRRNGKGTRHQYRCMECNGVLAKELTCQHCRTNRVWRGAKGARCHGCGHPFRATGQG